MADLLLVDDDADMAELVAEMLREEGHEVRLAANGLEGLACVDERFPDVVLLDVDMPRLNGPDMACRLCGKDVGRENIPLILFSGEVQLDRIAERVGTPYFLAKPNLIEQILAVLQKALYERTPPRPAAMLHP